MSQTIVILHDSLRHLRSQSLFWIAIGLSATVAVLLFGLISFTPEGWRVLWLSANESDVLRQGAFGADQLLRWLFGGAFVFWWLSWGAIILALISTASVMPEFASSGSVDLAVSKPISRAKLLLVKVLGALLFMFLQVTVGVLLAWLLMGWRFDMWFHAALLAIPLLVLQFLYLYAVMALAGIVTRSTLASLIATLVFWAVIALLQFAANLIDGQVAAAQARVEIAETRIAEIERNAQEQERELTGWETGEIRRRTTQVENERDLLATIEPWQKRTSTMRLFVPKTGDIQKIVADLVEAPTFNELIMALQGFDAEFIAQAMGTDDVEFAREVQVAGVAESRAIRDVETWKSIGTSLIFTGVVLGLATLIFVRRDF